MLGDTEIPVSAFDVYVNSFWRDTPDAYESVSVSSVDVSGNTVELTLDTPIENDQKVKFSYTDPSEGNDDAVQDIELNDVVSLSDESVTNNSTVTGTAPTYVSAKTTDDGTKVLIKYSELLGDTEIPVSAFDVSVNSFWRDIPDAYESVSVSSVDVSGNTVELTLDTPIENDQKVKFSYVDPSEGNDDAVQDIELNDVVSLSDELVTNNSTVCLLYTSPSPRDGLLSRMPSSA